MMFFIFIWILFFGALKCYQILKKTNTWTFFWLFGSVDLFFFCLRICDLTKRCMVYVIWGKKKKRHAFVVFRGINKFSINLSVWMSRCYLYLSKRYLPIQCTFLVKKVWSSVPRFTWSGNHEEKKMTAVDCSVYML